MMVKPVATTNRICLKILQWHGYIGVEPKVLLSIGVAQPQSYSVEPINAVFVLEDFSTTKDANDYLINLFANKLGYV